MPLTEKSREREIEMARDEEVAGEQSSPELQRSTSSESQQQLRSNITTTAAVLRPKPDPFLIVCGCFSVITALSAILCIGVNILSAIRSFKSGSDVFDGIFRCYAVVLAVFVVIAETEWGLVFKFCKVLEYWPGRAMLQIFVAIMTRAFPDYSGKQKDLILLHNMACYLLLSCGAVYFVSGILCIGYIKRARQKKQTTRDQAVKDLEELERRRQELESLLVENRD